MVEDYEKAKAEGFIENYGGEFLKNLETWEPW